VTGVIDAAFERARGAAELLLGAAAHIAPGWLAAGLALHLLAQAVRIRGWWNILRASYPTCRSLRHRDVTAAYFAGAGLNGLLPARAGDLVKLAFLRRRIPESRYATLAASSVPETTFEVVCGAALVVWMLVRGFVPVPLVPGELPSPDVSWYMTHPATASLATVAVLGIAVLAFLWVRRRSASITAQLRRGLAIFSSPRDYLLGVVTWQALGRVIRLASLGCCLAAFALPATLRTALLVMAAQGGGRIIPIAPVSAGLRIAMLSYGLVEDRRARGPGCRHRLHLRRQRTRLRGHARDLARPRGTRARHPLAPRGAAPRAPAAGAGRESRRSPRGGRPRVLTQARASRRDRDGARRAQPCASRRRNSSAC
jgi:hypothetical protein